MCYDDNARPPIPPGSDGQARGEDLVLTGADGNTFAAFIAHPSQPLESGAQVLIYPDVRGLYQFYKELALRLAGVGITAISIDYFGRTAGLTERNDAFEYRSHVMELATPDIFSDTRAALAQLEAARPTFIMGFCLGGSFSLLASTEDLGIVGAIGFYAGLSRTMKGSNGTVLDESVHVHNPFLGLFGGADQNIPPEQVHALDDNLAKAGVDHQIVIYEGAPHSFFDRRATDYADASADSWIKILAFVQKYST